jgi:SAM-dependent methyltransferase
MINQLPQPVRLLVDPLTVKIDRFTRDSLKYCSRHCLVLDPGAGECRHKSYFEGPDIRYVAIDFLLGDASWDYSKINISGKLTHLPIQNGVVDILINNQVLEHVEYPELVLKEFSRVLKEGGVLCLTVPQGWYEHQEPHDYFRFTRFGLKSLASRAGLEVEEIKTLGGAFQYVANRLTYLSKIPFRQMPWFLRLIFLPVEITIVALFGFFIPALLNVMDGVDQEKKLTLGYSLVARKPRSKKENR